jgi:glycosyltransferase involved in cell wall biosynthesis
MGEPPALSLRVAHLTTVDMSLALLLETELVADLEAGHEVIGISAPGPYVSRIERLGVRHVALPSLTRSWDVGSDVRAARELWRSLRRERPDVLHTHNPKTGVLGRVLGRLARVPAVVNTCHGLWAGPGDPLLRRVAVLGAEAFAARFSHAELYQNADDRRALSWAVPRDRAEVVGNGVDLDRFRYDAAGRARVRAEWGVGEDEIVVGAVGRRVAEKGLPELAQVASAAGDSARFVWVGPDDEAKSDRVEPAEAAPVQLVGGRDDMPAVYSAFDVFALPTHREGFSRSAMEAAACGRPMVLTDIRGCREIGTDGEHLLLVPPRDVDALEAAVRRLLEDGELRDRLGAAAARRAAVAFDQRRVAARSLATYERVLARRRP